MGSGAFYSGVKFTCTLTDKSANSSPVLGLFYKAAVYHKNDTMLNRLPSVDLSAFYLPSEKYTLQNFE